MTPERFRRLRHVLQRRQPDLTVLMEGVHKPHNLSAVARSCDAVGVLEIHTVPVEGLTELDLAISAGSSKWVPTHDWPDVESAIEQLRGSGHQLVAAHPHPQAVDFRAVDYTRPTCFVVGSELHGLSERALSLVDHTVVAPMEGMVKSLNVSVASAVLLYEAQRQREAAGYYDSPRLEEERLQRLLFQWAYPRLASRCDEAGLPYPELDEEGELGDITAVPGLVEKAAHE